MRSARTDAAARFGALVGERLADLAMAGARVEVRVGAEGTGEPVEIALGANLGEAVLPLARAASGGELARAMLALRLVARAGRRPWSSTRWTPGSAAPPPWHWARRCTRCPATRQVLVVTHLAQVAALADQQVTVARARRAGRTVTSAAPVGGRGAGGGAVAHALGPPRQRRGAGPRRGAARRASG